MSPKHRRARATPLILTPRATPKPAKRRITRKADPRPPSPSDDPLLLTSPPLRARFTPAFSSSPAPAADPPVSFAARLSAAASSSPDTLPVFDVPRTVDASDAWSDSDSDDEFNLLGEYTGKFKVLRVPTKADPPKERSATWGRPVSPFPYSAILERSLPLAEDAGGCDATAPCEDVDVDVWEVATEPPSSDVEHLSVSEDEFADLDDDFPVFDAEAESTVVRPFVVPVAEQASLEEEEEEEQIDRELSVAIDDVALSNPGQPIDTMEDGSSEEEDDVEGEDIIKITSDDPKAAARAAAILRMHDYDCFLAAEKRKRATRKRRKTIENAGISKSYADLKSQRWKTFQGSETSPGSRSLPLLELWRDAEDSVFLEHHSTNLCDTSFTLSPLKPVMPRPLPLLLPPGGDWTRDCWKSLDKCLVAERLAVAATHGLGTDALADVQDISKDAVLDRFVDQLGGESIFASFGSEWSRDNLFLRLDVLIKKQSRHTSEPRYRQLLHKAMALERCPTTTSMTSDTTVVSERHDVHKVVVPDASDTEFGWQSSRLRGPVRTPSRTPDPTRPHPKDQVHLRHASLPHESMIPVSVRPKRLVDLRHLSPMKPDRVEVGWRPTARRSSGCSVRELVKVFEDLDK